MSFAIFEISSYFLGSAVLEKSTNYYVNQAKSISNFRTSYLTTERTGIPQIITQCFDIYSSQITTSAKSASSSIFNQAAKKPMSIFDIGWNWIN
jgi:hypothetical protein